MRKVSNRAYIFQKVLDYIGVTFLGVLLLFIWQLYRGPIDVPFLKPYIMQALNHDESEAEISVGGVSIELVRSLQPIKIVAKDIEYKRNDESVKLNAPRTTVSFSLKALLRGIIAPSSISIESPSVYIFSNYGIKETEKNETGKKKLDFYFKAIEDFLERFSDEDHSYVESYINSIKISSGELEWHEVDLGKKWSFSDFNYTFSRNLLNISSDANALINVGETLSSVGIEIEYRSLQEKLALDVYFSDIIPNELVNAVLGATPLQELYQINLPVGGRISTLIDIKKVLEKKDNIEELADLAFEKIKFQLEGGQGEVTFKNNQDNAYHIDSFLLEGDITGGLDKIAIKDAAFDIGGQQASLNFDISGFKKYFFAQSLKDLKLRLVAAVDSLEVNRLYDYWPKYVAEPGWNWCYESMRDGIISNAKFTFDFGMDAKTGEFGFVNLDGAGDVEGVSINYLTGMPKIVNGKGHAVFTKHNIKIIANSGESEGVQLVGGYINLYDLDKEDNFADISLEMESSVEDALKMIDHQPLNYTTEMGLNPDEIKGQAKTKLDLKFEMKQNLRPEEVKVKVVSDVTDFKMLKVFKDNDITADNLKLEVTNQGLRAQGNAILDEIPVTLVWTEDFSGKEFVSHYNIGFKYNDKFKKKLGLDISILNPPYIKGEADMEADITIQKDKKTEIVVKGDIKPLAIDFSFLGFRKKSNVKGSVYSKIIIQNDKLKSVPELKIEMPETVLSGRLGIDTKGRVNLIDINNIKGPKTNAKAKIDLVYEPKMKAKVNISGQSYDLSPFFEKSEEKNKIDKEVAATQTPQEDDDGLEKTIDADIYIAVNNLWTNPHIAVSNFAGNAKLVNGIGIEEIHVVGNYKTGKNSMLKFDYVPKPNKEFYLSVTSNDAGATMKVLHIYDDMEGGNLKIEARRNKDKAFIGHAKIRDFNIQNTPLIAKFLSVASFKGMLDLLMGEGIAFSHLDAPFEYRRKQLMLKKAKAFGNVLGITANGTYDRRLGDLDIRGRVAPAYSLNMILGSIPLVGNLLAGKDGTIFAANYYISGDIEDASIQINPLSVLSPNSLKETISALFGTDDD